jgi:uncharacterized protein with HEPN domain
MRRDDAIRIRHMIEAAEACERFVSGRSRAELEINLMLRFALVRAAEIFGEAASKVSLETRVSAPLDSLAGDRLDAEQADPCLFRH